MPLYHITDHQNWNAAQDTGAYRADSLESEGFIHCSTQDQVVRVANALYRGQANLLLLVIDPDRVQPEIRYEDSHGSGELFPHIYGPLNLDAVSVTVPASQLLFSLILFSAIYLLLLALYLFLLLREMKHGPSPVAATEVK